MYLINFCQIEQGDDDLMHFKWKDRTSGTVEDDLIIFPDDIDFVRVDQVSTLFKLWTFGSLSNHPAKYFLCPFLLNRALFSTFSRELNCEKTEFFAPSGPKGYFWPKTKQM